MTRLSGSLVLALLASACAHAAPPAPAPPPAPVTAGVVPARPPVPAETAAIDRVPPFRTTPLVAAWGPEPPGTPHAERRHDYDLRHQSTHVRFDWARHAVVGTTRITVAALDAPLPAVALDAVGMRIRRVALPNGRSLAHSYDGRTLTVRPPAPVAPHRTLSFDVAYETIRPKKGAYFIDRKHVMWTQGETEDNRYWVPTYDYPDDKETWDFYVTTARNEKALSNGRLAGRRRVPGGIEWHWVLDKPASTYLMSVVTGDFAVLKDHWRNVPVDYWVYPDSVAAGWRGFGMTPRAIDVFSRKTGVPYPWSKYDQSAVPDYIFGGMENVTATTQEDDGILHPASAEPEAYSGDLVSHELGHQWYGDLLTLRTWSQAWLNEGFATFMQQTFREADRGQDEGDLDRRESREQAQQADIQNRRPLVYDRWVNDALELFFSGQIYPKGAAVLQMLRHQLGDSTFWAAMHRYTVEHEYQNVTSADLEHAFEQTTGRDYAPFFRQWVYGAGFPVFRVSYGYDAATHALRLVAREVQPRDSLTGFFDVDVDVTALTDAGPVSGRMPVRNGTGTLALALAGPPRAILWDPDGWLLQEADFPRPTALLAYQLAHAAPVNARLAAIAALAERAHPPAPGSASADTNAVAAAAALAAAARGDRFWGVRRAATTALAWFAASAGATTRAALLAATGDADPRVRTAAAEGLGHVAAATGATGATAGTGATGATGAIGATGATGATAATVIDRLRTLATTDPSLYVRGAAIRAFAALDPGAALPVIETMLREPSWIDMLRVAALEALSHIPADTAVPILERYVGPDRTRFAREAAIGTLMRSAQGHRAEVARRLAPLLNDEDLYIRGEVARALGVLGQQASIAPLRARRRIEAEGRVQSAIEAALARLAAPPEPGGRP